MADPAGTIVAHSSAAHPQYVSELFAARVLDLCDDEAFEPMGPLDVWMSKRRPASTLACYVWMLCDRLDLDEPVLAIALVLLARFKENVMVVPVLSGISLCEMSAHRLSLSALVIARLWHEDVGNPVDYAARCSGVSRKEFCRLVRCFLSVLGFRCFVKKSDFDKALEDLRRPLQRMNTDEALDSRVCEQVSLGSM